MLLEGTGSALFPGHRLAGHRTFALQEGLQQIAWIGPQNRDELNHVEPRVSAADIIELGKRRGNYCLLLSEKRT